MEDTYTFQDFKKESWKIYINSPRHLTTPWWKVRFNYIGWEDDTGKKYQYFPEPWWRYFTSFIGTEILRLK